VHFCFYFAYMFYAAFILMRQDSAEGEISGETLTLTLNPWPLTPNP